jgi:hypothetical protein
MLNNILKKIKEDWQSLSDKDKKLSKGIIFISALFMSYLLFRLAIDISNL